MFTTFIVQPIFNLLTTIYALLPGHDFGLTIIIFTIVVRLLMWPLVKKQLHQVKVMRKLQPELRRIKAESKGDKRKESALMMELYKERGVNPFGQIGVILLQMPILIGLYSGIRKLLQNPHQIVDFSYGFVRHFGWLQDLSHNIHLFEAKLFGVVDLTRSALGPKGVYWPALLIVVASAAVQFLQSKQLTPVDKNARKLRDIMRDAKEGKQADSSDMNAAMGKNMTYILPFMILLITVNIASALSLYWLVGGLVAYIQQSRILREDTDEMESEVKEKPKKDLSKIVEAEVVKSKPEAKKKTTGTRKKRRSK